jgi:hypothetical protein
MEATRLAPAGRACSKFVWQSRFQKNWAVRVLAIRAARPLVIITHRRRRLRVTRARDVRPYLIDSTPAARRRSAGPRFGPASWKCAPAGAVIRPASSSQDRAVVCAAGAGHVVAAFGRHSSRPKCGGRRDGCPANRRLAAPRWEVPHSAGGRRNSLANSKRSGINSAQRA